MAPARPSIPAQDAFGLRVQSIRRAMRLTQNQFAKQLGCAQGHLSEIEAGKYAPSVYFIACIGHAFPTVDLRWVILGEGEMYRAPTPIDADALATSFLIALPQLRPLIREAKGSPGKASPSKSIARLMVLFYGKYLQSRDQLERAGVPRSLAHLEAGELTRKFAVGIEGAALNSTATKRRR